MKTNTLLRIVFMGAFILGTLAVNAQTKIYVHKTDGTAHEYNIADIDSISFTAPTNVIDYSELVINEVDGIYKFIELYNKGTESIPLKGITLIKNESQVWWTGKENTYIAPGEFYSISNGVQSGLALTPPNETTGNSGISPKQNVKFELKQPDGTVIDEFVRTNGGNWGDSVTPAYDAPGTGYSFSRVPDGTGIFQLAEPSCNLPNNESEGDIVTDP